MTELKRNEVLSFDDGLLTVKMSGHGEGNGWATLAFNEKQFELDDEGYQVVEIPPSELFELRDFLNRILPSNRPGGAALQSGSTGTDEAREPFERFIVRAGFTDWVRHGDGYLKPLVDRLWRAWPRDVAQAEKSSGDYDHGYADGVEWATKQAERRNVAYAAHKPVGWFQYSDYHGWQQVAKEYEGGEGQTALYALSSTERWTAEEIAQAKAEARELYDYFHPSVSSTHQQDAAK